MTKSGKPNFYTPEEYRWQGSGSKYDLNIDNAIIQTIFKYKKIGFGDLKAKTENFLSRKSIGPSSYAGHIRTLTEGGILLKEEHGIGRKVEYSLTQDAIKK